MPKKVQLDIRENFVTRRAAQRGGGITIPEENSRDNWTRHLVPGSQGGDQSRAGLDDLTDPVQSK